MLSEPVNPPTRMSTEEAARMTRPAGSMNERPHPRDIQWISEIVHGGKQRPGMSTIYDRDAAPPNDPPRELPPPSLSWTTPRRPRRRKASRDPREQALNSPRGGSKAGSTKKRNVNRASLQDEEVIKRLEGHLGAISKNEAAVALLQLGVNTDQTTCVQAR